jgi:aspartate aminotransferase
MEWDLHELDRAPAPMTEARWTPHESRSARPRLTMKLPTAIERWLAPQERFDALRSEAMRRGGADFADLAYANPQDGPPARVLDAIRTALDEGRALDLQYTPYGGAMVPRRLVARALSAATALPFRFSDVVLTPGAMGALTLVMRWLAATTDRPGEIIIPTPCWLDHPLYAQEAGLRPVLVPLDPDTLRLDLAAIARALTDDTVAIVLTQPGNPTGLLHTSEELAALGAMLAARTRPPLLVSDEAHRDVVFDGAMVSPAAHYARTAVVYSFGKTALLQGQRVGYVAVSPRMDGGEEMARDLVRLCRVTSLYAPTALMQRVIGRLLEHRPDLTPFRARRRRALDALDAMGWDVVPSDATFFLYPRVPGGDAEKLVETLARRGTLVLPAEVFHHTGHVRLSLTCTDAALERALQVMREVTS